MAGGRTLRAMTGALSRLADRVAPAHHPLRRAVRPAYSSLLAAVSGRRGYPAEINGHVYRIDPRFRWSAWHAHEREVADHFAARIHPGQVIFDVGANVGLYVLQFARWSAPDGRIFAFEPNPATLPVLRKHIALNDLESRVTVIPKGAGASAGTAALFDSEAGSGLSRIGAPNPGIEIAVAPTPIALTTIDDYCAESGIVPDWILIDVEGYEYEVLQGAAETLRQPGVHAVVELHPRLWPDGSREAGERLLRELGLTPVPIGEVTGRRELFVSLERSEAALRG
jgi:FkbM family methyltransferase